MSKEYPTIPGFSENGNSHDIVCFTFILCSRVISGRVKKMAAILTGTTEINNSLFHSVS